MADDKARIRTVPSDIYEVATRGKAPRGMEVPPIRSVATDAYKLIDRGAGAVERYVKQRRDKRMQRGKNGRQ